MQRREETMGPGTAGAHPTPAASRPGGRARPGIGIDIGSRSVKVAWIARTRGGGSVWHMEQRPCPTESPDERARALEQLLRPLARHRFDLPVILSVAESHVRLLTLDLLHPRQLPEAVRERVPLVLPFELAHCHYHYRLIRQQPTNGRVQAAVQVAACSRAELWRNLELLLQLGWAPSHVSPSALALESLVNAVPERPREAILLLDVGARRSSCALMVGGVVVFARDVRIGSEDLTEALMVQVSVREQSLQLSRNEAESLKRQLGLLESGSASSPLASQLPPGLYQALLQPVLEQWLVEIQRTITSGTQWLAEAGVPRTSEAAGAGLTQLWLSGGGSQLVGVDRWLNLQLGLPVERVTIPDLPAPEQPPFAVACGLALGAGAPAPAPAATAAAALTTGPISMATPGQGRAVAAAQPGAVRLRSRAPVSAKPINLLPARVQGHRGLIRTERLLIAGLIWVMAGLWLAAAGARLEHGRALRRVASLEGRSRALEPVTTLWQAVASRLALIGAVKSASAVSAEWFDALSEGFPNPVRLTELEVSATGDVHMAGQAEMRAQSPEAAVSELAMWLAAAEVCRDVRLGSSQRNAQQAHLVDFLLTCQHG